MNVELKSPNIKLKIGDIVCEILYIIPPDRKQWFGMVVDIVRDHYDQGTWTGQSEDMVSVKWFGEGIVEHLPAPVLVLVQQVK